MSQRACPRCGKPVDEKSAFCPNCGYKMNADTNTSETPPPSVGYKPREESRSAMEHLTIGFNVSLSNPLVFLPTIISGIIGLAVSYLTPTSILLSALTIMLGLLSTIISFILNFASMDMSRDAYNKQPLDLAQSIQYVMNRLGTFIVAAIFGAILSITIVLIPVVILTFVIMVLDETGILDALGKAFKVLFADLGDVLIILLVSIIGSFILGYIPFLSTLLNTALTVIIGIAFIDIYVNYQNRAI
jgi:hypothetical protein